MAAATSYYYVKENDSIKDISESIKRNFKERKRMLKYRKVARGGVVH